MQSIYNIILDNRELLYGIQIIREGSSYVFKVNSDLNDTGCMKYGRGNPDVRLKIYKLESSLRDVEYNVSRICKEIRPLIKLRMSGIESYEPLDLSTTEFPKSSKRYRVYKAENLAYEPMLFYDTVEYRPTQREYTEDIELCRKIIKLFEERGYRDITLYPQDIPIIKSKYTMNYTDREIDELYKELWFNNKRSRFVLTLFTDQVNTFFTSMSLQAQAQIILLYGMCDRLNELTYI